MKHSKEELHLASSHFFPIQTQDEEYINGQSL